MCQGRGSAANSAVCYALQITAVDPVGHGLLFERFLSEERKEVPDIDIDFAHQDREKVIQYVYDRYGREHAAMAAEVITYRTRSAIRDVGKALGLSLVQVEQIAQEYDARESLAGALGADPLDDAALPDSIAQRRDLDAGSNQYRSRTDVTPGFADVDDRAERNAAPATAAVRPARPNRADPQNALAPAYKPHPSHLYGFVAKDFGADPDPEVASPVGGALGATILALCRRIDGFPRHMGIHSGGMVITREPLVRVAPIEWASMRDRTIVQWDKDDLNDLGLIKIDLLGLGMLSLLRDAFTLFTRRYPDRAAAGLGDDSGRRPPDLRDAAARRFDRRVPSRIARAAIDAAAFATELFLRSGHASRDHSSGSDSRRHDPSVPAPAQRHRACHVPASETQAGPRTHAGRAAVPRTGHAHGDRSRRIHARRGRHAAPRDGPQTLARTHGADLSQAHRRHGRQRHRPRGRRRTLSHARRIRRLRFSRIARGEFRAAGLCVGVREVPRTGNFLRRDPQRAADGILRHRSAGQRCPPPRRVWSNRSRSTKASGGVSSIPKARCGWAFISCAVWAKRSARSCRRRWATATSTTCSISHGAPA